VHEAFTAGVLTDAGRSTAAIIEPERAGWSTVVLHARLDARFTDDAIRRQTRRRRL